MKMRRMEDLDVRGRRVLVRSDLNVPVRNGEVGEAPRIEAATETIAGILERGGRAVILSHLGRPGGERDERLSLRPVAAALSRAMGRDIGFAPDCVGEAAESAVRALGDGEAVVLDNLRFHPGETTNASDFAAALAALGDLYVNDAFSASHRAHASIVGLAERLPCAAGMLMVRELDALERHLSAPRRPFVVLLGGAKVATKIGVVRAMLGRADRILLGGAMANTFLAASGQGIGRSRHGEDEVGKARDILDGARAARATIVLPTDAMVARGPEAGSEASAVPLGEVAEEVMILDLGPETVDAFVSAIGEAATVVWNGPVGVAGTEPFGQASLRLAKAIARRTEAGEVTSVVGGGDTTDFLQRHGLADRFTYVSLAGGAFLDWLAGKRLPGVEALRRRTGR